MTPEGKIQSKIIKFLRKENWHVFKIISASPNKLPDIIAHKRRKVLWIEVKAPGGVLHPLQSKRHRDILKLTGETVLVPYSYEEFLENYYKLFG